MIGVANEPGNADTMGRVLGTMEIKLAELVQSDDQHGRTPGQVCDLRASGPRARRMTQPRRDANADKEEDDQKALQDGQAARDAVKPRHKKAERKRPGHDGRGGGANPQAIGKRGEPPKGAAHLEARQGDGGRRQREDEIGHQRNKVLRGRLEIIAEQEREHGRDRHQSEVK